MSIINETSLSRVWSHFTDPNKSAAILTAFRGGNTPEENLARNRTLAADIRSKGYGYIFVDGYWIENQGTPDEQHVKEVSLLVNGPQNYKGQDFAQVIHELGNKFNQDAVIVKDSKGTRLIFSGGDEQELGSLQPGKLAQAYTRLRNSKKTNTFVFESEREDLGFIAKMAVSKGIATAELTRLAELAGIKKEK